MKDDPLVAANAFETRVALAHGGESLPPRSSRVDGALVDVSSLPLRHEPGYRNDPFDMLSRVPRPTPASSVA